MKVKLKISQRVGDHLINAVLIFASVFLAFWMNEVRVQKKEAQLTNEAKTAILTEWKINLMIIERSKSYHENIINPGSEQFIESIDPNSLFDIRKIPGLENGIQKETISNNSNSLVEGQKVSFDIKTRLTINHINEQQKALNRAYSAIINDFLTQRELFDSVKTKENYLIFFSLLEKLIEVENTMIERLKTSIAEF